MTLLTDLSTLDRSAYTLTDAYDHGIPSITLPVSHAARCNADGTHCLYTSVAKLANGATMPDHTAHFAEPGTPKWVRYGRLASPSLMNVCEHTSRLCTAQKVCHVPCLLM